MKVILPVNDTKTMTLIKNKNLVHVQVHFLKIEHIHVQFTQNERIISHHS